MIALARRALSKPLAPVFFFFAGVTYDTLTLTRIDRFLDNLILLVDLALLGSLILLVLRPVPTGPLSRLAPYAPMGMQFLFGSLFSAYAIYYSQSASWTATAVFFFILVALLVANEFLKERLSNATLLISLYAVVSFSFLTFFLPVATGYMNTYIFLAGAVVSALTSWWFARVLARENPRVGPAGLRPGLAGVAVVSILVLFYFLNWIPPVPLSLKFGGMYRAVSKTDGHFRLTYEQGAWYQFWKRSDDPLPSTTPAYCFTAVFAPVDLRTTVYHRWQHRADGRSAYATTDRIGFPIAGGRDEGYRGYTMKQRLMAGDWRVDVETADGRIIGRVRFTVTDEAALPGRSDTWVY